MSVTFTESGTYPSQWLVQIQRQGNITVSAGDSITVQRLVAVYARHYTGSDSTKNYASMVIDTQAYKSDGTYLCELAAFVKNDGNGGRTTWPQSSTGLTRVPVDTSDSAYIPVSKLFNSSNPTERSVEVAVRLSYYNTATGATSGTGTKSTDKYSYYRKNSPILTSDNITITLSAYPDWDATDPGGTYAPGETYSVNVSNLRAMFGGYITDCRLVLGDETVVNTSGGTMTVSVPATVGQYEPYIQVTDSRGQTSTQYLSKITVRNNSVNVASASATRVNSSGIKDDSGTYAMIQATFNRLNATFLAPTVAYSTVGSSSRTSVSGTWYTSWSATGGFSNAVSNWSSVANGATLYFKANGTYDKTITYMLYITPRGTATEGDTLTGATYGAYLSQEFFLISGRRGGKGLGIGRKADSNALQIGIPTQIISSLSVLNGAGQLTSLVDLIYPIGSYYETSDPNFNPATYWGGKWELEPAGRVNISGAASGTYIVPNTGGSPTATGQASVPLKSHSHSFSGSDTVSISGTTGSGGSHHHTVGRNVDVLQSGKNRDQLVGTTGGTTTSDTSTTGSHTHSFSGSDTVTISGTTGSTGTDDPKISISVTTIQPWRAVYRWHRIP